jgi:hypothetical protein
MIDSQLTQEEATISFEALLQELAINQSPLCISAHGNNTEIGDDGETPATDWGWTTAQVAGLLKGNLPAGYEGPILIHACATSVANFSAGLAVELEKIAGLCGIWVYGYNTALPREAGFPNVQLLDQQVNLQATKVVC